MSALTQYVKLAHTSTPPPFRPTAPLHPGIPMDIDAQRAKASMPHTCHHCGSPNHLIRDCPHCFDIRHMCTKEIDDFFATILARRDTVILHNKVKMDPVKIAGVSEWPTPTNKKEVQSFISFINFYRRFIPNFSQHARPLFDLTMKNVRFI
jgi:hypothetical protein